MGDHFMGIGGAPQVWISVVAGEGAPGSPTRWVCLSFLGSPAAEGLLSASSLPRGLGPEQVRGAVEGSHLARGHWPLVEMGDLGYLLSWDVPPPRLRSQRGTCSLTEDVALTAVLRPGLLAPGALSFPRAGNDFYGPNHSVLPGGVGEMVGGGVLMPSVGCLCMCYIQLGVCGAFNSTHQLSWQSYAMLLPPPLPQGLCTGLPLHLECSPHGYLLVSFLPSLLPSEFFSGEPSVAILPRKAPCPVFSLP